jgi:diguanylate cyclase (GGDEF)-like protein
MSAIEEQSIVEAPAARAKRDVPFLERLLAEKEAALVRAETELRRLATTDSLSGLLNRNAILSALEEEIRRAERYGRPLGLILFDLDHFKFVNDIHGREAGDEALKRFASICRSTFRNTDYVGRYSGEEFLAILPEVTASGALEAAERVRSTLQAERFQGKAEEGASLSGQKPAAEFTVTVSAGVAGWEDVVDSDKYLANADAALYRAKEKGRNRVELGARH